MAVERLRGGRFVPVDVVKLEPGDYFRVTRNGASGPLLKAKHPPLLIGRRGESELWSVGSGDHLVLEPGVSEGARLVT